MDSMSEVIHRNKAIINTSHNWQRFAREGGQFSQLGSESHICTNVDELSIRKIQVSIQTVQSRERLESGWMY